MLFDRIESPVPDWTMTPAATLNAIVLPWPAAVPPTVLFGRAGAEDDAVDFIAQRQRSRHVGSDVVPFDEIAGRRGTIQPYSPLIGRDHVAGRRGRPADRVVGRLPRSTRPRSALPRSAVPAWSMPMKLPSTRFLVDVAPSISTPIWLPEMTWEPWPFPSTIAPVALSISTPASALPRSASPVESVPIRLPITVTSVAVAPEINTPIRLAEITLPGPITVPGAVSATPAWSLPRTDVAAGRQADDVIE